MSPNPPRPGSREVLLASPNVNPADSGQVGDITLTITCDEPGWVDLSRGQLLVSSEAALANAVIDYSSFVQIKSFTRNSKDNLLRGASGLSPNFFARRQRPLVGFPAIYVDTATTFEVVASYTYTGGAAQACLGFPFVPDQQEYEEPPVPQGAWGALEIAAGSPLKNLTSGTSADLTITFSDDGVIDLDRLFLKGQLPPTASQFPADAGPGLVNSMIVEKIQLRKDRSLMSGKGTVQFPGRIFAVDRAMNWARLGRYKVKTGDALVVTVQEWTGTNAVEAVIGVPQLLMDWSSNEPKQPVPAPCAPYCGV